MLDECGLSLALNIAKYLLWFQFKKYLRNLVCIRYIYNKKYNWALSIKIDFFIKIILKIFYSLIYNLFYLFKYFYKNKIYFFVKLIKGNFWSVKDNINHEAYLIGNERQIYSSHDNSLNRSKLSF